MALLHSNVLDNGLNYLSTSTSNVLYVCSTAPTSYAQLSTYGVGTAVPSIGSPEAGSPDGRKVVVATITAGDVTVTGTAAHWAIGNTGATLLLATQSLSAAQAVTSGNVFTLDPIDIRIPDPA
jgi:hypothetical protein